MLNKIKESATSYAKDAAMDFAMTSAKKAVLGTPSEVQVSVNQHAKDTKMYGPPRCCKNNFR